MFRGGDHIGPYTLLQKIGRGAFGEVWLAEEKTAISTHRVALKLPNEEDVDLEAIRLEANLWEEVKGHPNVLPIIKADVVEDQLYIASEYASDGSLSKWLKMKGGIAPTVEIATRMIHGILAGLAHLHSKGIIHRDLKPENILLQAETPRIADFGIARLIRATSNSTTATGTPSYMAPECFYGTRSVQTDLWAVGVIFHLLLSGKLPFPQQDQVSVMNAVLNGEPEIDSSIPLNLQSVILRCLRKSPEDRHDSAIAMLRQVETPHPNWFSGITIPTGIDLDTEVSTVVIPKHLNRKNLSNGPKHLNIWKKGSLGFGILIVALGLIWARFQLVPNEKVEQQQLPVTNENGNLNVGNQPTIPTITPNSNADSSNTQVAGPKAENQLGPSSTNVENDAWPNGAAPGYVPPAGYTPPGGQVYTVQPSDSPFMDNMGGVELRCRDMQTGQEVPCPSAAPPTVKPSPTPKAPAGAANTAVQPTPVPATTPKPMATPPPKNIKPATDQPDKDKAPAAKPGKSGTPKISELSPDQQ